MHRLMNVEYVMEIIVLADCACIPNGNSELDECGVCIVLGSGPMVIQS